MKNFLFNNYNIRVDKIYKDGLLAFFYKGNEKIYIIESTSDYKELDKLYELTNKMYINGIKVNTFILNNNKRPYTKRNKENIILLKENQILNDIRIKDFECYQKYNNDLELYNLYELWKNEIDTIEREIIEYNKEYPLIQESIDYYIGMGENAIELLYEIKNELNNMSYSIGHKVAYELFNKCKLEDPFTFIRVNRMYDISNYIKYMFYKNEINYDEIDYQINHISEHEKIYLFACLLYPNIYFNLVKNVLLENDNEDKINLYIKKIKEYEKLLCYFRNNFKSVKAIDLINWIYD